MNLLNKIKGLRHKAYIKLYSLQPIQQNKIIIWSDVFKTYGCNPKYITEYIVKNYPNEFDIVWVIDAMIDIPKDIPNDVRIVRYFSVQYLKELHTAHYIICNQRIGDSCFWHKRDGQIYIQTWHSSLRLKTIEKDAVKYLPEHYIQSAKMDSKRIDYIISGCKFSSDIFKNSFWYDGEVIECGTPRIDYLFDKSDIEHIYSKTNLSKEYKYIIYAPTFRDNDSYNYNIDFKRIIAACEKRFGGKWKVLYRLHPNLIFKIGSYDLGDECINMCRYPDIQELLKISDMLITDYSSCMFDMMFLGKPCIEFMPDLDDYIANERKLYFDINELPFETALTVHEAEQKIIEFDNQKYDNKIAQFMQKIGSYETGNACENILKKIFGK